jgi:hypothetical protein
MKGIGRPSFATASTRLLAAGAALALAAALPSAALADENGISFWLPGQFGSLAAAPLQPGLSVTEIFYNANVTAGADVALSREITIGRFNPALNLNLSGNVRAYVPMTFGNATYVFATPVLGGQASIGMTGLYARNNTDLSATISGTLGPIPFFRSDFISQQVEGFGDLYPMATLRWNKGVDNFMVYATGDIPVGLYSSSSIANIGIGHGAIDSGVGYTYLNPQTGHEFSVVTGLTYNFINPSTQYQNGLDWHLDWGAAQFINKAVFLGAVGYVYQQVTADSGGSPRLGPFESRVIGVGPQVGVIFPMQTPVGPMQGYLNLKGYAEFDDHDRPAGWNAWITLSISPPTPAPPAAQPTLVHK